MSGEFSWNGIEPRLTACLRAANALPDLPARSLLHAGPPFASPAECTRPILNAAVAAVLAEGWCTTVDEATQGIVKGEFKLIPAQDWQVVTPLACVVSPSMPLLRVEAAGMVQFTPVNDGPPDGALRFGDAQLDAQCKRIALMKNMTEALDLALSQAGGVDLLPVMAHAIGSGDDLHGSVSAMSRELAELLDLPDPAMDAFAHTPLFGLNPVMAAASVMLAAAGARSPQPLVIAAGGNGKIFGWKTSDAPSHWVCRPALQPIGPRIPGKETPEILPAIGDSAVIEALGLGGAILRYAPTLIEALAPYHPAETFTEISSAMFVAPHPSLPSDIRLGLPVNAIHRHSGIMLGMVGRDGEGLLGRGLTPWPR